jgi:hypothetical protein
MNILHVRSIYSSEARLSTCTLVVVAICLLLLLGVRSVNAETTCRDIEDPRWPGLQECVVKADVSTIVASPPKPQQRSLWCWAASLSMIFTAQGHRISQNSIVLQNFGALVNAPGGDFLTFQSRLNRQYRDDDGEVFTASATRIRTMEEAANALDNDIPLLYTTSTHATVQTELTYQQAPGGPMVIKGGKLWDPWPGKGWRRLDAGDVRNFIAAWSIETN